MSSSVRKASSLPAPWSRPTAATPPVRSRQVPPSSARYVPAAPQDESWGLLITEAGYVKAGTRKPSGAGPGDTLATAIQAGRKLPEYQLHYFPAGGGTFESEPSGRCEIQAGDFCLVFPEVWHRYVPPRDGGWDEAWVGFHGPHIDQLVRQGSFSPLRPVLRPGFGPEIVEPFRDIFAEIQAGSPQATPVLAAQTMLLLARILAGHKQQDQGTDRIIQAAKSILRTNLDCDIDLHALAGSLNTSYTWLRRSFRLSTGLTLHQYHLQLRIEKAWQLLATSGCTVREAAEQTGFNDEFYFSRLFKLKTGRSPESLKPARVARSAPTNLNPVNTMAFC
ncbi:MAG: AraC family transcriptional regulator [Opitutaceae bacterium]|nr:AraC family transcriptional regulator [Opitutaceae bacterium]